MAKQQPRGRAQRTGGRAAGRAARPEAVRASGAGDKAEIPTTERSTTRMERKEQLVGLALAVALALVAVLFITVLPPHGQKQPDTLGPTIALVVDALFALSLLRANRILTGVLAILTSFLLQTPGIAHSLLYLRTGELIVAVIFAGWLTLQQRHAQIDNRMARTARDHRERRAGDG